MNLQEKSKVRLAEEPDLARVIELNKELNPEDPLVVVDEKSLSVWREIIKDKRVSYFVLEVLGQVEGGAMLIVSPNLTRGMRPLGVLQSVIVSSSLRGQGFGKILVGEILEIAKRENCYQVLVQTGRPETIPFYKSLGFKPEKTGLVARP